MRGDDGAASQTLFLPFNLCLRNVFSFVSQQLKATFLITFFSRLYITKLAYFRVLYTPLGNPQGYILTRKENGKKIILVHLKSIKWKIWGHSNK